MELKLALNIGLIVLLVVTIVLVLLEWTLIKRRRSAAARVQPQYSDSDCESLYAGRQVYSNGKLASSSMTLATIKSVPVHQCRASKVHAFFWLRRQKSEIPEIRITFPDEVQDELEPSKMNRIKSRTVVVSISESGPAFVRDIEDDLELEKRT
ncbi:hypothetical protein V1512DRAFT_248009 [Lipomyces arxii]|uniref:uncharacterized protein n=1 Tax=Lipomyces arxii TaxID=56418 RepID=UPI0034D000DF